MHLEKEEKLLRSEVLNLRKERNNKVLPLNFNYNKNKNKLKDQSNNNSLSKNGSNIIRNVTSLSQDFGLIIQKENLMNRLEIN